LSVLRATRQDRRLSQREVARRLAKPPSYVNKCETGERQLNIIELRDWCGALEMPWVEFVQRLDRELQGVEPA